jgi:hypothetical protein
VRRTLPQESFQLDEHLSTGRRSSRSLLFLVLTAHVPSDRLCSGDLTSPFSSCLCFLQGRAGQRSASSRGSLRYVPRLAEEYKLNLLWGPLGLRQPMDVWFWVEQEPTPTGTKASTGNQASRRSLVALRQNSEAVHGLDKLTHRNPHIQPADPYSETSKGRKESINSPTNSCQCLCVMDAPEIYYSPGLVVVSEFLTAIQASNVRSSAIDRSVSR